MSIVEISVVTPMLFGLLVGISSLGNGLSRIVQANSMCHSANRLMARGFDLSRESNQELLVEAAVGLGLDAAGAGGKAAFILTRIVKVGSRTCALGVGHWNGHPDSCPNYGKYVIAGRLVIGNSTRWHSVTGSPASPLNRRGEVSDDHIAAVAGNRVSRSSDEAGNLRLGDDQQAYVTEVFVDAADLSLPIVLTMDTIKVCTVS
jgi:hypothetical protein